jgi:hypothetical protein
LSADQVAQAAGTVEGVLRVKFQLGELQIDSWGQCDKYATVGDDRYVILEVDGPGQKHPCTNVLKLWPYLEKNPKRRALLIHVCSDVNDLPQTGRARLAQWTAKRMQSSLGAPFLCVTMTERQLAGGKAGLIKTAQSLGIPVR